MLCLELVPLLPNLSSGYVLLKKLGLVMSFISNPLICSSVLTSSSEQKKHDSLDIVLEQLTLFTPSNYAAVGKVPENLVHLLTRKTRILLELLR